MTLSYINVMAILKKQLQSYLNEEFKNINLTSSEIFLLHNLYKNGDKTQIEIARNIECDKAHIHRITIKLIEKDLIKYIDNNDHIKNQKLSLTNKGTIFANQINQIFIKWRDKLLQGIDKKDLEIAKTVIEQLVANSYKINVSEKNNA